jgi:hypothetical protein
MGFSLNPFKAIESATSGLRNMFATPDAGDSGSYAVAEEARKARLRSQIDAMFGIAPTGGRPVSTARSDGTLGGLFAVLNERSTLPAGQADYDADVSTAGAANDELNKERTDLTGATRGYYTDELGRDYTKAERNTRFNLARQGLMGGSEDAYQQGEVSQERDLGATRIDDAVRRAVTGLDTQRENERLNAINLVNSGSGTSAVASAQAGLKNAFQNISTQNKADLFSDLFSGAANTAAANNLAAQNAAMYGRYYQQVSPYFNYGRSTSGRVTAGGVT